MFTEYRKTTTYYGDDGNIVDTDDESEADKVVNDDTNDNDVVKILVDNYLIHELDEANAIWGEDKLQSVPNKRNKYYLVISNENNERVVLMLRMVSLIKEKRKYDRILKGLLVVSLLVGVGVVFFISSTS